MRPPRRPRGLSGEDARLWTAVARLITPLSGRALPHVAEAEPAPMSSRTGPVPPTPPPAAEVKPPPKAPRKRVVKPSPQTSPPPSLLFVAPPVPPAPGLERRVRLALRRGALRVDARLDLHGLYQAEAHGMLIGFLMRARAAGHTHVLVVTGKGGAGSGGTGFDDAFSERGVLRRSVPHWLRAPELHGVVLGFEEAARHHGGAGALYVRLRRR